MWVDINVLHHLTFPYLANRLNTSLLYFTPSLSIPVWNKSCQKMIETVERISCFMFILICLQLEEVRTLACMKYQYAQCLASVILSPLTKIQNLRSLRLSLPTFTWHRILPTICRDFFHRELRLILRLISMVNPIEIKYKINLNVLWNRDKALFYLSSLSNGAREASAKILMPSLSLSSLGVSDCRSVISLP